MNKVGQIGFMAQKAIPYQGLPKKQVPICMHGKRSWSSLILMVSPLDKEEAEEYARLLWEDGLIAEAFRYSETHCRSIDPQRSLHDFFAEGLDDMFLDEPPKVAAWKRKLLLLAACDWGAYIGSPIERQSLRFFWLEQCIEGENPFAAETYQKILDAVAKPAQDFADIKLKQEVLKVRSNTSVGDVKRPTVDTDQMTAQFDAAVVTAPLGWLKRNQDVFHPALPSRLSQAFNNIGYGTLDKVYITFPSAFWDVPLPEDHTLPNGIDPGKKTPNVAATTIPLHHPSPQDTGAHHPGFVHWLSPTYATKTNPHGWDQQAVSLAALPSRFAQPTLLFYIYGDCSKHIADTVPSSRSDTEIDFKLTVFFRPYYALLPNYDEAKSECIPKAILATAWANDEFAGYGSYSNFQVGLEDGDKDIETMRYGMPERHIWFAGEHTAPFAALGTTTGAYISGEKAAEKIIDAFGLNRVE